jgi:hypothetical protein
VPRVTGGRAVWNSLEQQKTERNDMTNEEFVRQAYAVAEVKDIAAWVACFNPDGVFVTNRLE